MYFGKQQKISDAKMSVKCGQCIGCRLDRSREWAIRCVHEAQYHDQNCFLTLTFAEDPVTLSHTYFQKFLKRLRKAVGKPIRFYMCGEYGAVYDDNGVKIPGELGRPHFHAIVFGHDFEDKYYWKKSGSGFPIYRSDSLDKVWKHGHAYTQEFSVEAAAYVARYVTKKITGDPAVDHYQKEVVHKETGEILKLPVIPEYTRMSLRDAQEGYNGIGSKWIHEHFGDLYPKDFVTHSGIKFRAPRYYDKIFESIDQECLDQVKESRREHARSNAETPERLEAMEKCKVAQASRLVRNL